MDVTIDVKENITPPYRDEIKKTFFGKEKTVRVARTPSQIWEVHLTLLPTEEERAIIHKYRLAELIVEEEPLYSEETIAEVNACYQTTKDDFYRKRRDEMRVTKAVYRIKNYFDNPFVRTFNHPKEAHEYVDKLKQDFLPIIKSNIDNYVGRVDKETFSL
jgi:hypothetical protein